jgi:hypothetical protein
MWNGKEWVANNSYLKAYGNKATMVTDNTNSMYQLECHVGYLMIFYRVQMLSSITLHERIVMYG